MAIYVLKYTNGDTVISSEEFVRAWNLDYLEKGHALWSCEPIELTAVR